MGRALARVLDRPWVDTDHLIEQSEDRVLRLLLRDLGPEGFITMENRVLANVNLEGHIISSGGSLVYSVEATEHLRSSSYVIFLDTPLYALELRLGNLDERGTVRKPGQSLASLLDERLPLYRQYADLIIDTEGMDEEDLLKELQRNLLEQN